MERSALALLPAATTLLVLILLLLVALLVLAALLALTRLLLLVLLVLVLAILLLATLLATLIALATLILLITHWNVLHSWLPPAGASKRQREASLLSSRFQWRYVAFLSAVSIAFSAKADDRSACFTAALGSFWIASVTDGRSVKLADGREVMLAGIEVPSTGKTALERLLAEKKVVLKQSDPADDRYGRLLAQVFVPQDGAERWIQNELLAAGQAQVAARPGSAGCAKALLAAEAPARRSGLGLWANSSYSIKASDDLAGLLARRGRFTVAEGKVVSVRESGGTIYVNFGRVWSRNLTVTILGRNRRAFEAAGVDPKKLEGTRLRVRGFIEERSGPRLEAVRPEQIEIAAQE